MVPIATPEVGQQRLVAELDRTQRYARALTVALVRLSAPAAATAVGSLRAMDLVAECPGGDYLVILPELAREAACATLADAVGDAPQAIACCPGDARTPAEVLVFLRDQLGAVAHASHAPATIRDHLAEIERSRITAVLAQTHGNQTHAARVLGLSRRAIIYKMEKYGLKAPPK